MKKNFFIQSTMFVAIFTLISKFSGFGVDALLAYIYGPSFYNDLYVFIVSIVTMIFIAVGSAVSSTFSPILSELIIKGSKNEQNEFISNSVNIFSLIILVISLLGIVFSKYVLQLFAPGFITNYSFEQVTIVDNSIKLIFCVFPLVGVQSVFVGVLNCYKNFKASSAVSIYTNVVLILFLCFFHDKFGDLGLIFAVVFGYITSLVSLLLPLKTVGFNYIFIFNLRDEKIKHMLKRLFPVLLGSSVLQLNLIIDSTLASTIGIGALSTLNYASKLNIIITHVIGMAIATVAFPVLSELSANNDKKQFRIVLEGIIRVTNIIIIPFTLLIITLKEPVVAILFERGQFNHNDTLKTSEILLYYSPAMIFITLREILNRAFYSMHDTRTPMIISIVGVLINVLLKIIMVKFLGLVGIAIATSLSVILVTIGQISFLKNKDVRLNKCTYEFVKILIISVPLCILPHYIYEYIDKFYANRELIVEICKIGFASIIFVLAYISTLFLLKIISLEELKSYLVRGNGREKV